MNLDPRDFSFLHEWSFWHPVIDHCITGLAIYLLLVVAWIFARAVWRETPMGTRSILCGYHQFLIHPLFMAWAWWRLYGFPCDPRLWCAFFLHDLGYWGCEEMDGKDGAKHPYFGAHIMHILFDKVEKLWIIIDPNVEKLTVRRSRYWWGFMAFHSRHLAEIHGMPTSNLAAADKLVILMMPIWLQVALGSLTGEIKQYMTPRPDRPGLTSGEGLTKRQWVKAVRRRLREWFKDHYPHLQVHHSGFPARVIGKLILTTTRQNENSSRFEKAWTRDQISGKRYQGTAILLRRKTGFAFVIGWEIKHPVADGILQEGQQWEPVKKSSTDIRHDASRPGPVPHIATPIEVFDNGEFSDNPVEQHFAAQGRYWPIQCVNGDWVIVDSQRIWNEIIDGRKLTLYPVVHTCHYGPFRKCREKDAREYVDNLNKTRPEFAQEFLTHKYHFFKINRDRYRAVPGDVGWWHVEDWAERRASDGAHKLIGHYGPDVPAQHFAEGDAKRRNAEWLKLQAENVRKRLDAHIRTQAREEGTYFAGPEPIPEPVRHNGDYVCQICKEPHLGDPAYISQSITGAAFKYCRGCWQKSMAPVPERTSPEPRPIPQSLEEVEEEKIAKL